MVSGIHSRHTIRSEIAKWRRKSWTEFLWPRRRKVVMTAATTPLPITPMIKISPEKETVTFHLVALLAFFSVCQPLAKSLPEGVSLVLFGYFLPHAMEPKTVLHSGFHAMDSVFRVPDSWFFVSGTWIPDSNFQNCIPDFLYYYMRNFCNLSLIWKTYMWKLQNLCG